MLLDVTLLFKFHISPLKKILFRWNIPQTSSQGQENVLVLLILII